MIIPGDQTTYFRAMTVAQRTNDMDDEEGISQRRKLSRQ